MDENWEFVSYLEMHASNSTEQRNAEQFAIKALSVVLGAELKSEIIQLGSTQAQIDGYDANKRIMAEFYSGFGVPKPGQVKKVLADAFKLILVERFLQEPIDKYLCFIDAKSYAYFAKGHWYSEAFETFGIKAILVGLPIEIAEIVREAKNRQGSLFKKGEYSPQA